MWGQNDEDVFFLIILSTHDSVFPPLRLQKEMTEKLGRLNCIMKTT